MHTRTPQTSRLGALFLTTLLAVGSSQRVAAQLVNPDDPC